MKSRTIVAAALLAVGLLPFGAMGHARAATPLSSLALRKSDMPPGYRQTAARSATIQSEAKDNKVSVTMLRSHGWQGSYNTTFETKTYGAAAEIDSGVERFKSARGAAWYYNLGVRQITRDAPHATWFPVHGVGETAFGFKISETLHRVPVAAVSIGFRRGSYLGVAIVSVAGSRVMPPMMAAEIYARIVDARLKRS
ncbi:MAG: hypothetical protein JOZ41_18865 [Chloroflexi bacterium]|nr:hypothetical protein [Chloroflexota bacterium]